MSFETFLNQFKSKYQKPKDAFDYVFATERNNLDKLKTFLSYYEGYIAADPPAEPADETEN